VAERFLRAEHLDTLLVAPDVASLIDRLRAFRHPGLDKRLDRPGTDQPRC
jgi:hypothetical protein